MKTLTRNARTNASLDGFGGGAARGRLMGRGIRSACNAAPRGQSTRHAWKRTGEVLAATGYRAIAFAARGHGDSDWAPDGAYTHGLMVQDLQMRDSERMESTTGTGTGIPAICKALETHRGNCRIPDARCAASDQVICPPKTVGHFSGRVRLGSACAHGEQQRAPARPG